MSHHAEESIGRDHDGRKASTSDREEDSSELFNDLDDNLGSGADVQVSKMLLGSSSESDGVWACTLCKQPEPTELGGRFRRLPRGSL